MFLEAPIDAIRARIGWTDMPSDIAAVDLYRPLEHQAVRLARKGFPDFVSENERRLVGKPRASRELESRYALRAVDEDCNRAEQVDESQLA